MKHALIILAALAAACSSPAEDPVKGVDAGGAPAPNIPEGLYTGTSADNGEASLAVWPDGDGSRGTLAVGTNGFEIVAGDIVTLAPLDGVCEGCAAGPWDLTVDVTSSGLDFTVISDGAGPGFVGLNMVPHDGFKPEFAPGPGVEVWSGKIVAIAAAITPPILDRDCELSIDRESGEILTFDCLALDTDSGWTAEAADSWESSPTDSMFETSQARYEGVMGDDGSGPTFVGRVLVDGVIVGGFDFLALTP